MVTSSINPPFLPQEIMFLILQFATSERSKILLEFIEDRFLPSKLQLQNTYMQLSQTLLVAALVSKSWTSSAQTLLLQSVALFSTASVSAFLNAPLSQFDVKQLFITLISRNDDVSSLVGNILSKLSGLESLGLRGLDNYGRANNRKLNVSVFLIPNLSKLERLCIFNLLIHDEAEVITYKTIPLFIKHLNVNFNSTIPDSALNFFVTPSLTELIVSQVWRNNDMTNVIKVAAPHVKEFSLLLLSDSDSMTSSYRRIFPLFTSLTKFHLHFSKLESSFDLVSEFPPHQLVHLTLSCTHNVITPQIIELLRDPSCSRLETFTLYRDSKLSHAHAHQGLEVLMEFNSVARECRIRGIYFYSYVGL